MSPFLKRLNGVGTNHKRKPNIINRYIKEKQDDSPYEFTFKCIEGDVVLIVKNRSNIIKPSGSMETYFSSIKKQNKWRSTICAQITDSQKKCLEKKIKAINKACNLIILKGDETGKIIDELEKVIEETDNEYEKLQDEYNRAAYKISYKTHVSSFFIEIVGSMMIGGDEGSMIQDS